MKNIRERIALAHQNRRTATVEVSAWPDKDGKPTTLYFTEMTAGEAAILAPKVAGDSDSDQIYALVDTIILKALDDQLNRVFTEDDRELLLNEKPDVLAPIGEVITSLTTTVGEAAKN